jgi:hypothetical protein
MIPDKNTAIISLDDYNKFRETTEKYNELMKANTFLVFNETYHYRQTELIFKGKDQVVVALKENFKKQVEENVRLESENKRRYEECEKLRKTISDQKKIIDTYEKIGSTDNQSTLKPAKKKGFWSWF